MDIQETAEQHTRDFVIRCFVLGIDIVREDHSDALEEPFEKKHIYVRCKNAPCVYLWSS